MIEKCLQRGCKSEENVLDLSITMFKIRIFHSVALKMCFWYFRQAQPEATGGGLHILHDRIEFYDYVGCLWLKFLR